ncbi:cytochrome c [Rhodopirellula sp. JC639]|uniref:cytochrome c n=1 Tax=Stieleria mannarensis TaxID=2755585 RepID=UPI00160134AB|nr:cytochrome c [Rhodopirellula sp. JC639]
MKPRNRTFRAALLLSGSVFFSTHAYLAWGEEKRAPKPKFSADATQGIFFDSVGDAIRGQRPTLQELRKQNAPSTLAATTTPEDGGKADAGRWDKLISPTSIEDEIKRVKLHYDSVVTQPGPFKSGGYEDARLDLMVMSSLFAIITEYQGDVRWKDDAAVARDLLGRTAFNCNAGTNQVFNEARARKDDLQDLMSGTGLRGGKAAESNDWASIADRAPLMEYAEILKEQLRTATNSADDVKAEPSDVRRPAELLAIIGRILVAEGMDDADDEDYAALSEAMTKAARGVTRGLELDDYNAISQAVGAVTQSCDDCHGQYR